MQNKVLMVIPAYNERMNIEDVIREIKRDIPDIDILVVNDCSTDGTLDVLKHIPDIIYLSLPFNLGYSNAVQTGFKYARDNGYDYLIQFDGDGQHIATEAKKMLGIAVSENLDIVIGSRFKALNGYKNSFFRKIGTNLFVKLIRIICHVNITDPTSGLQVLCRRVFVKYASMFGYPEYPDANLIIKMILSKYRIVEVEVKMKPRLYGVSMHSGIIKPIKYMIEMLYAILLLIFRKSELRKHSISSGGI